MNNVTAYDSIIVFLKDCNNISIPAMIQSDIIIMLFH